MRKGAVSALLSFVLAISLFGLAACGGSVAEEQDNCYGEDLPVINE